MKQFASHGATYMQLVEDESSSGWQHQQLHQHHCKRLTGWKCHTADALCNTSTASHATLASSSVPSLLPLSLLHSSTPLHSQNSPPQLTSTNDHWDQPKLSSQTLLSKVLVFGLLRYCKLTWTQQLTRSPTNLAHGTV